VSSRESFHIPIPTMGITCALSGRVAGSIVGWPGEDGVQTKRINSRVLAPYIRGWAVNGLPNDIGWPDIAHQAVFKFQKGFGEVST
jgi:hypothetical protein